MKVVHVRALDFNSSFFAPFNSESLEYLFVCSTEVGHYESGLEEMEQVPVQDPSSDDLASNAIRMPSYQSSSSSSSANQDNELNLIPEQLSAIEAAELRRAASYNRRRRQPKIGKFVFPIRYTRKPRFRSSHSALVSGVDSGYGDLANVLASHYGLEKPNKVLRYGIS